ncbi:MAG: hypothetical protein II260_02205 [Muribaculaceae bacterium]|nr:hypothetical protein [Muribaculaceae bacterium]
MDIFRAMIDMDELNDYLECTCGRCDDGICRCSDFDNEPPQYTTDDDLDYDYDEEDEEKEDWE